MDHTKRHAIVKQVKQTYEDIGTEFSASRKNIWPDLKPFLERISPHSSVLDVGCGNGRLLTALPQTIKYTGLDQSTALLSEASKLHPDNHFIETDITQDKIWKHLPKYDTILCIAVIHHLPDRESQLFVLKQIITHLKPKGKFLITAWNLWQKKYLKYHLNPALKWQNPYWVEIPFQTKKRFCFAYTKPYLAGLFKELGIKVSITSSGKNYLITTSN